MNNMSNFIGVTNQTEGILGKFLYYSLSNVLIDKADFCRTGETFGLAKVKPSRESASDAFRNATTAVTDRIVAQGYGSTQIFRVYFRDNQRTEKDQISRELVKETLGETTNMYRKLANIFLDKNTEHVRFENVGWDPQMDVDKYCARAAELFDLYKSCYTRAHVDSVVESLLEQMQASKISVHGKLYFVPKTHTQLVDLLEDYFAELNRLNQNEGEILVNSMFVVDDAKQREKMTQEFYANFRKEIEFYQDRVQHFIATKCQSQTVIDRWRLKIQALEDKKRTYEDVLRQELGALDDDFAVLKLQSQELTVQGNQLRMDAA